MALHTEFAGETKVAVSSRCDSCLLRTNCFIARLTLPRGDNVERISTSKRAIPQGQFLFRAGDPAKALYIVKVGAVKTLARLPRGGETVLAHHFPGDIVGATAINRGRHPLSAQALTDTRVCELPWAPLTQRTPDGLESLLSISELISREVDHGYERMLIMSKKQPSARVAHFILAHAQRMARLGLSQSEFFFPISISELAKYLGLARETVSRQISTFRTRGLIDTHGRIMKIKAAAKLRDIAEGVTHKPALT